MDKINILVVGQAPPAVKQKLPYDTTMWYDWLEKAGIIRELAPQIFDYDSVYWGEFLGYTNGGHTLPTIADKEEYWDKVLKDKVEKADRILTLGNVAKEWLESKGVTNFYFTLHPSKRNKSRYDADPERVQAVLRRVVSGI